VSAAGPLRRADRPLAVVWWPDADMRPEDAVDPHRHDYHELIWLRRGTGRHRLDGREIHADAGTITVIGRGQVHVFDEARGVDLAIVRFTDELLYDGGEDRAARTAPGWMLAGQGGLTVPVPPSRTDALEALLRTIDDEVRIPPDTRSADLQRHLLSVLLLWIDRWAGGARGASEGSLHERFLRVLERDYAGHHDAAHYADALAVPAATLSRTLAEVTGRTTKELVSDRVLLEAARLLRYTDLSVGQVAHRVGFEDPLYFSRAFKRREGVSPLAYREAARGSGR
jgi:AraC family transcriptional activator of pobA